MKTFTATIMILLGFLSGLSAQEVTGDMAATVARNFIYEKFNQYVQPTDISLITIREELHWKEGDQNLLYIFNMNPAGFVIVSAHQALPPVLGYSCEHSYLAKNQPPNVAYWIGHYAEQVKLAQEPGVQPGHDGAARWERYLDPGFLNQDPLPAQTSVGPLLTTLWDQGWPYNYYCPETTTAGSGGHVWAGCVATACQQLFYYYRWPDYGRGKKSYIPHLHPEYGVQSADFGATRYRFEEMVNTPQTENLAIAEQLYHIGVALEMDYDPSGSAPWEMDSLTWFFKALDCEFVARENYTDSAWMAMLRFNMDKGIPIFYMGSPLSGPGHAFVCDGYQDSLYFHFNLGWSGKSNGYYLIDNVVGYNYDQEIIVPTFPDTINFTWPQYLPGKDTLTAFEGSITDGSGPLHDYLNNVQYKWLIDPQTDTDSISYIRLSISRFSTAGPGDRLIIYDGKDVTAPILADLYGDTIPPVLSSSGNQVMLIFTTDASGTGPGFLIDYLAEVPDYCPNLEIITDSSSHIFDGSGRFPYHNSTLCRWRLEPKGCDSSLTLHFSWFDTEPELDYLEIYDAETLQLLAKYSGHYAEPPAPVVSPSGKMYLIFKTSKAETANGWEAWYGDVTGISEHSIRVSNRPNPVSTVTTFFYHIANSCMVRFEIMNSFGQVIEMPVHGFQQRGDHSFDWNTAGLPAGIYLYRLQAGDRVGIGKVVKQ